MKHKFYKYQGTGNDFVIIDNRQGFFDKNNTKRIKFLCDRRFGIGADGLILLENHNDVDFKMKYFNADGNESSMCGNGGRCIVAFAKHLGIVNNTATFKAIDGIHHAILESDLVKLQMQDVASVEKHKSHIFLDTGSPHHVEFHDDLMNLEIKGIGAKIRYGSPYNGAGANVNFVSKVSDEVFSVRTYERGVEDETLSCGTGVTAVAIAMHFIGETKKSEIILKTEGGDLKVSFNKQGETYTNVWLTGPAIQVFIGEMVW